MNVTRNDLQSLLNNLWNADTNQCIPEKDYALNIQGRLRGTSSGKDMAKNNLFSMFNEERVFSKPTYKLFRLLLDNYELETGVAEIITPEEIREGKNFLNAIMETEVMKILHRFLIDHKLAPRDPVSFKKELNRIWFEMYKRSNVPDSSGFEHVFVGELKQNMIIGLHNWIQIYLLEKAGKIDYKGFFEVGTSNESKCPRVITIQLTWKDGQIKPLGSSFVGTSPEFEIAFFTALHFCNVEYENNYQVGQYHIDLVHHKSQNKLGTAYIKGLD